MVVNAQGDFFCSNIYGFLLIVEITTNGVKVIFPESNLDMKRKLWKSPIKPSNKIKPISIFYGCQPGSNLKVLQKKG